MWVISKFYWCIHVCECFMFFKKHSCIQEVNFSKIDDYVLNSNQYTHLHESNKSMEEGHFLFLSKFGILHIKFFLFLQSWICLYKMCMLLITNRSVIFVFSVYWRVHQLSLSILYVPLNLIHKILDIFDLKVKFIFMTGWCSPILFSLRFF